MMNVFLDDEDSYLQKGIKTLLLDEYNKDISFCYRSKELYSADIMFFRFNSWDVNICHCRFFDVRNCILVGIADVHLDSKNLPLCIRNIIFLTNSDTKKSFLSKLQNAKTNAGQKNCSVCPVKRISNAEIRLVHCLRRGMKIKEIAFEMGLSTKTVYSHQYNMMDKFGLNNKTELCIFILNNIKNEMAIPGGGRVLIK